MKVGVIGAGTMGSGIAQTFAQCPDVEKVYLCDIKEEFAENGKNKIKKALDKRVARGKMTQEEVDQILGKITTGLNTICIDPDLIVEASIEDMESKKNVFRELQYQIVRNPKCIYATNSSSLSITEIGAGLPSPCIGMHYFNPAPAMKMVEVIAGINTYQKTVDRIKKISEMLGKTPVQVDEAPGFVVNRILIPMINEAIFVYSEGIAKIRDIDIAMKLGCNHPMGPLELGDYIGLDIVLAILETIYRDTGDSKYRPAPLLRKMVRGNKLGVKSGVGFYDYADGQKVPVDEEAVI
ncbi:MAG: 3-hydroxyacyl-CoA dehydrogenase NAD-binding domain-containing protein [Lachnospiraceae bacterium]|nr:3-hydroxyacyl-CoA dehydrogenase NAD-binding domain-containing protein [Lachnospiraceae bacterium]